MALRVESEVTLELYVVIWPECKRRTGKAWITQTKESFPQKFHRAHTLV